MFLLVPKWENMGLHESYPGVLKIFDVLFSISLRLYTCASCAAILEKWGPNTLFSTISLFLCIIRENY